MIPAPVRPGEEPILPPAPLLVALVDPPHGTHGGDWYYRSYVPGRALAEVDGVHVVYVQNQHRARKTVLREADVVVLHAVCDADLFPVIRERARLGRLTVFEINDDFRAVQAANPVADYFANPSNRRLFFRLAQRCGVGQFSVRELERLYGAHVSARAVFENQLPALPPPRPPRSAGPVVIGWGGSAGHLDDMATVAPALRALVARRGDVRLRVMGSPRIAALFEGLPRGRFTHVPAGSIHDYHAFVDTLDVGIAPLRDEAFNRSRSDVKFLEYACHGVVPVVQRLVPYAGAVVDGENGFFFDTPGELSDVLVRLVDDPALRTSVGARARASVSGRTQDRFVEDRLAFYRSALAAIGWRPRPAAELERLAADLRARDGAAAEGRYLRLDATAYETTVIDGLTAWQWRGDVDAGAAAFARAAALAPEDHLPWLLRGLTTGATEHLERAVSLDPRSIVSLLALGGARAAAKDPAALGLFLRAAELEPAYDAPYLSAAALLRDLGMPREAEEFAVHAARATAGLEDALV